MPPRMLVVGASAYARVLDFPRFNRLPVLGAYLMWISPISRTESGRIHPSPIPYADLSRRPRTRPFVVPVRHRQCKAEHAKAVDKIISRAFRAGP